jgi:2-methylisocitrate lyase-like PEP mutase family enzyme
MVTGARLSEASVKRISVGGSLSRFALSAFPKAAREMKEQGAFTFVRDAAPSKDLKAALARGAA